MSEFIAFVAGVIVTFIIVGISFGGTIAGLKNEAVKNRFAEYNSTNGNWQWKTNATLLEKGQQ